MSIFIAFIMLFWVGTSWGSTSGMKVTASGYEKGNKPDNAIDQDYSTHWTCRGERWLQLDAGSMIKDNDIFLLWKDSAKPREAFFDVALSIDGKKWKTVFSGSESDNGWYAIIDFEEQRFRYVRVIGHGNSISNHNSIVEISGFEPDAAADYDERIVAGVTASSPG